MSRTATHNEPTPIVRTLALVTVYGEYLDAEKDPFTGTVEFTPTAWLADRGDAVIIPQVPVIVKLDDFGRFSTELVSTASPGVTPNNWVYQVRETINGYSRVFYTKIDQPCSMSDLVPLVPEQDWATSRGPRGYSVLSGPRNPTPVDGVDGDSWVNTVEHTFWAAKANGQWGEHWYMGGEGTPGPPGPPGPAGAVQVYNTVTPPTSPSLGAIWLVP